MTHIDKGPPGVHPWGLLIDPPYFQGWMVENPRTGCELENHPHTANFIQFGRLEVSETAKTVFPRGILDFSRFDGFQLSDLDEFRCVGIFFKVVATSRVFKHLTTKIRGPQGWTQGDPLTPSFFFTT